MVTEIHNEAEALLDQWAGLSRAERIRRFHALPHHLEDDFFLELSPRGQVELLLELPEGERRIWLRLLEPDDSADLIQETPPEYRQGFLGVLDESTRREVEALLAYKEDVAGGLMSPRFARLRPDATVDEAIRYLRQQVGRVETIYYAYALDEEQRLTGVVSLRELLAADGSKHVRDIMKIKFVTVPENTDQEKVAKLLTEHRILAIPVVDREHRMKGVITVDDIVDVVREEDSEDIQKMGGMEALDGPYLETGFLAMVKKRAGWLVILFLGEMLTATAMSHFEEEIARAVVLALFIPLLISSGGNSGSQATTLVIRAMALGELKLRDWWRVIRREVLAGFVLGCILGIIGLFRILVWQAITPTYGEHYILVAATIALSLVGVVTFGTLAGSMLPFILRRFGLDPASASAPFVATLVDVTGLVIYFTVAKVVLSGTLL
jgi:magnesium transporter